LRAEADELLNAFARSNLEVIAKRCADDIVLWGTDEGETWKGKEQVLASFDGAFDLDVRWVDEPLVEDNWVTGMAEFRLADGTATPVRVTMVFRDGLLAHAHYSVAVRV